jgi:hypothetical protein
MAQAMAPPHMVASVSAIQNFGSFVCASLAPIITGWLLDRTPTSFHYCVDDLLSPARGDANGHHAW